MLVIIKAIVPVFLLVLIGVFLKRQKFPGSAFWPLADKLTYYVLLPSLLVEKLALAEISAHTFWEISYILPLAILLIAFISIFFSKVFKINSTVIFL